jgi:hypothetical protein
MTKCKALTINGVRCKNASMACSQFCHRHHNQKRKIDDNTTTLQEQQSKRLKTTHHEYNTCITSLSRDEISIIIQYLTTPETIFFAFTTRYLFQTIQSIIKLITPIVLSEQWSLSKALQFRDSCVIKSLSKLNELKRLILQQNITVTNISVQLKLMGDSNEMPYGYDLISFLNTSLNNEEKELEFIKVNTHKLSNEYYVTRTKYKLLAHVTIGHSITNLNITEGFLTQAQLYITIASCPNIQILHVANIDDGSQLRKWSNRKSYNSLLSSLCSTHDKYTLYHTSSLSKEKYHKLFESDRVFIKLKEKQIVTDEDILVYDTSYESFKDSYLFFPHRSKTKSIEVSPLDGYHIFIQITKDTMSDTIPDDTYLYCVQKYVLPVVTFPTLYSLHTATLCYVMNEHPSFISTLLQSAPNLTNLKYYHDCELDNRFLHYLAKCCTKLKKLKLVDNDDADPTVYTDQGVLDLLRGLPQLTEICFDKSVSINGSLLSTIGLYGQNLTNIYIHMEYSGEDDEDTSDIIRIGGGVLHNLHTLHLSGINSEDLSDKFTESLISNTPNLKVLDIPDTVLYSNKVNLSKILQHLPLESLEITGTLSKKLESQITRCSTLKTITFHGDPNTLSKYLKSCRWNLRCLKMKMNCYPSNPHQWISMINKKCSLLEELSIEFNQTSDDDEPKQFINSLEYLLKDQQILSHLKILNLQIPTINTDTILLIRPILLSSDKSTIQDFPLSSPEGFIKHWLSKMTEENIII